MSSFDERKKGFEKKFAHDEEKQFKINARKNKYQESGPHKFWDTMRKKKINIFKM